MPQPGRSNRGAAVVDFSTLARRAETGDSVPSQFREPQSRVAAEVKRLLIENNTLRQNYREIMYLVAGIAVQSGGEVRIPKEVRDKTLQQAYTVTVMMDNDTEDYVMRVEAEDDGSTNNVEDATEVGGQPGD